MSLEKLYKYSGAGNDFIVLLDDGSADKYRNGSVIKELCDRESGYVAADGRIGADGLMILSADARDGIDFRMEFYNPDGSGGMMCGNGGRCIAAFADELGLVARSGDGVYCFEAADGLHTAEILERRGKVKQLRLKMIDAFGLRSVLDGFFVDTGTRHFVKFVPDVELVDLASEGPRYRYDETFAPQGANANFVSQLGEGRLAIRTWEKGVEAETLACGTGITAAAIAAYYNGIKATDCLDGSVAYRLKARTDELQVEFEPCNCESVVARNVFLTGPAELIR